MTNVNPTIVTIYGGGQFLINIIIEGFLVIFIDTQVSINKTMEQCYSVVDHGTYS